MTIEGHKKAAPFIAEYDKVLAIRDRIASTKTLSIVVNNQDRIDSFTVGNLDDIGEAIVELLDRRLASLNEQINKIN